MKKLLVVAALCMVVFPLVAAADLTVEILDQQPIVIAESEDPAQFSLAITNNENSTDEFEIYSLVGVTIVPKEQFSIANESTRIVEIEAFPHRETRRDFKGFYTFEYEIKGQQSGFFSDQLRIEIVELTDAVTVSADSIGLDDEQTTIRIKNHEDVTIEGLSVIAKSQFFEFTDTLDLGAGEEHTVLVPVVREGTESLPAGEYVLGITLEVDDTEVTQTGTVFYRESSQLVTETDKSGFIIRTRTIEKTNEGNVNAVAKIADRVDAFSRLFTTFSEQPVVAQRTGFFVDYLWEKEIAPGESFAVTVRGNYTLPFVLILLIVLVGLLAKFSLRKPISVKKNVSFVRTRGGEFALRVKLRVKARKTITDVDIHDRIPRIAKLFENAGTKPAHVDEKTRRLSWHIPKINAGEGRVITYVMYSKLKIIGRFELPAAQLHYKKDGAQQTVYSNKAYFAAETAEESR